MPTVGTLARRVGPCCATAGRKIGATHRNWRRRSHGGDGINDGPALAAVTVGIALGQGTNVAQVAADAILLQDNLDAVPWLIQLARAAMRKVRQNLARALIYNLVGVGLAVTGHLQPALAALLMVVSSLLS